LSSPLPPKKPYIIKKSLYNTHPSKKLISTPIDTILRTQNSPQSPSSQSNKKIPRISSLTTPSKKGPSLNTDIILSPAQTSDPSLSFAPGSSEKTPARAIFKVARKGKNKLVSAVVVAEFDPNL
jgi:hypothetical protein